jgi:hypothetical protein
LLLIGNGRQVESVPERQFPIPFVREWCKHGEARVRALLAPHRNDPSFIAAMDAELKLCHGPRADILSCPDELLDIAVRAVAQGLIGLASALPNPVAVQFDADDSSTPPRFDAVMFPTVAIAAKFLTAAWMVADNATAFGAALEHPAGRPHVRMPSDGRALDLVYIADSAAQSAALLAALLTTRWLALLPQDLPRRRLRLVWVDHKPPRAVVAAPASAAPPPRAASTLPLASSSSDAPASVIPNAPPGATQQVGKLVTASQNGTPFCEICAQMAAASANA